MPLVECDATGLEVVGAGFLSQCPVLCNELRRGVDIHGENHKYFSFPSRLIAKIFMFRLIYGGNEFSYANDPDFNGISRQPKFWKKIIDDFYIKYYGLAQWHSKLMTTVNSTGCYISPTGRKFVFESTKKMGVLEYPRTQILNYPVQSLGADIMSIIRVSAFKRIKREFPEVLFVNTVHDSILVDSPPEHVDSVSKLFDQVFSDFPRNFNSVFKSDFNLPLTCKVTVGNNWKDMEPVKK